MSSRRTTETSWRRSTETSLGVSFETYLGRRWDVQRDIVTTSPRRLAARWVSFEQELHDPVKAVRRIQDFNLTMVKLKLLVDGSLENPDSIMTNLKKLFQDVEKRDDSYFYQGIKLARYEAAKRSLSNHYEFTIASITDSMQNRFGELSSSPLFKNLVSRFNVSSWPKELSDFGSAEIASLKAHFSQFLTNNGCYIGQIQR